MSNKFKHPFQTPDNYFEQLKSNVLAKTSESLLEKHVPQNVYKVPPHFFEEQYNQILTQKSNLVKPAPSLFAGKRSLAWIATSACSIALLIFSYSYFGSKQINDILSKEGSMIQSDISDLQPIPSNDKAILAPLSTVDIRSNASDQEAMKAELADELTLESSALEELI